MTKLLEKSFIGTGEVRGFEFNQIKMSDAAYIYKVTIPECEPHFEVIKRLKTPILIDFDKRIYSETEFKEYYPKAESFGISAWVYPTLKKAMDKFGSVNV